LHRCTLVRAGRNSVRLLFVNLYFYFFIGLQFRAGQSKMPCLHKALFVSCHYLFFARTKINPPAYQETENGENNISLKTKILIFIILKKL